MVRFGFIHGYRYGFRYHTVSTAFRLAVCISLSTQRGCCLSRSDEELRGGRSRLFAEFEFGSFPSYLIIKLAKYSVCIVSCMFFLVPGADRRGARPLHGCRILYVRIRCVAERVPGECAVRGGVVSDDGGVLLGVPQAWGHRQAEAAALHHEPQQV